MYFPLSRFPNTKPTINKWFSISKDWIATVILLSFRSDFLIKRKIELSKIEFSCSLLQGQFNFEHLERKLVICFIVAAQINTFWLWKLAKTIRFGSEDLLKLSCRKIDFFTVKSWNFCAWEFCELNNKQFVESRNI